MRIALQAPVSELDENGKYGTGLTIALHNMGFDVYLFPIDVVAPVHPFIAKLMTKPPKPPYDLEIDFGPSKLSLDSDYIVNWDNLGLQPGYEPSIWKEHRRDWNDTKFCYFTNDIEYMELIDIAFYQLRDEYPEFRSARMFFRGTLPGDDVNISEGIYEYPDELLPRDLYDFYKSQHIMLALKPERNLAALEFMSTGGAVIAADWGENKGWLSADYCFPLPTDNGIELNSLKEIMWHLYSHRADTKHRGTLAASVISQSYDWANVLERFFLKLGRLPGGQAIKDKATFYQAVEATNREREQDRG